MNIATLLGLADRVAVVVDGSGVLGKAMTQGLLDAGALVYMVGRDSAKAELIAKALSATTSRIMTASADVTRRESVEKAAENVSSRWGRVDILVNAASGNRANSIVGLGQNCFDLPTDALRGAIDANLIGTTLPCQVFDKVRAAGQAGSIINISSMAAQRPPT